MKRTSKKFALAMLSVLVVSSLVSWFSVSPCKAADYTKVGVKVGDWAHYTFHTNQTEPTYTYMNLTVTNIDRCNVTIRVTAYNATSETTVDIWGNISSGEGGLTSPLWIFLVAPDLTKDDPLWIGSPFRINDTRVMTVGGKARVCNRLNITYYGAPVDIYWDQATGIGVKTNITSPGPGGIGHVNQVLMLVSTSLWSPPDYTKVGVKVGDWAHYTILTNSTEPYFTHLNVTVTNIDRCNVTIRLTGYNTTMEVTSENWGNISSGEYGASGFPIWVYLVAPNLTKYDPLWIGSSFRINDTRTMITGGKARVCNRLNITYYDAPMDIYWDQATGIGVKTNITSPGPGGIGHVSIEWNLISTSLWSPPDYTKVGVKVGDWAHYTILTSEIDPTYTNMNLTVTNIDRCNVTIRVTMYSETGEYTFENWCNISSGEGYPEFPSWMFLVAADLTKRDLLWIDSSVWINDTGTMITGGKARVCNHCNLTFSGDHVETYWDQATGIVVYYNDMWSGEWWGYNLVSTSLWSPPDHTKVGVQVGDWMFYSMEQTGVGATSVNMTVTKIDRCNVTLSMTAYYAGGSTSTSSTWGNLSDGTGSTTGMPVWFFLISGDLSPNDPLWIGAPMWINETVTMFVFGESRTCNHLNIDALHIGPYTISVDLYWDSATGVSVKGDLILPGEARFQWNLTSTSLWSPAPTIGQPAAVTYTYGTTGHSITWNPLSQVPRNYTITRNGAEVTSKDWNGESVTWNVDGLTVGTYTYKCTVSDIIGRRASSSVTVTVSAPAPTIDQPATVTYTYGTTGHNITWNPSSLVPYNYTITRNETVVSSKTWGGEAIKISVDGLEVGTYVYNCTVWDTMGRRVSSAVIVRVSAPAPTIDQPAAVTYTYGTTGHNITWNPSSLAPYNYTITRNGAIVSSGNWNGQAITISVDGLEAGTYVYNCTVWDTNGRHVSSSVTVTVNAAPPPQAFPIELLVGIVVSIVAVVIIVAVLVLRKRGR